MPFAGRIPAAGKTLPDIAAEIKRRLSRKANQPEVLVLLTRNLSSTVTVVGEVTTSTRVPLTAAHERLLDALAVAAGVKQPVNKTTIQITRGASVYCAAAGNHHPGPAAKCAAASRETWSPRCTNP